MEGGRGAIPFIPLGVLEGYRPFPIERKRL